MDAAYLSACANVICVLLHQNYYHFIIVFGGLFNIHDVYSSCLNIILYFSFSKFAVQIYGTVGVCHRFDFCSRTVASNNLLRIETLTDTEPILNALEQYELKKKCCFLKHAFCIC